jgi:hypothetical protein
MKFHVQPQPSNILKCMRLYRMNPESVGSIFRHVRNPAERLFKQFSPSVRFTACPYARNNSRSDIPILIKFDLENFTKNCQTIFCSPKISYVERKYSIINSYLQCAVPIKHSLGDSQPNHVIERLVWILCTPMKAFFEDIRVGKISVNWFCQ